MKRVWIFATAAATLLSVNGAQAGNFDGLLVGMDLTLADSKLDLKGVGSTSARSFVPTLNLAVRTPSINKWSVAVGATYDFDRPKFLDESGFSVQGKHGFSIYLAPGYEFTPYMLGYVKAGYHHTETVGSAPGVSLSSGPNFNGFSYGAGVQFRLLDNLLASLEFQQIRYQSLKDSGFELELSANRWTAGLMYRFDVYGSAKP